MADQFTHEVAYRGEAALKKLAELNLVICGAGAIGSNLAVNLARQGFKELCVIDCDRVEPHNVGTQVYGRKDVGTWKSTALQTLIYRDCGFEIGAVTKRLERDNARKFLNGAGCIVDAFDNSESRAIVWHFSQSHDIPCLHVGLDTDYAEVCWGDQYSVPESRGEVDGPCDYPLARNIALLAIAVASECLIDFAVSGEKKSFHITLKDRQIRLRS